MGRLGAEGYVVFVAGGIPGDLVRAPSPGASAATRGRTPPRSFAPSPERIPPRAHHPGVPWQVLPYERQLEIKRDQVQDALRRLGHLDGFELEPIVPAEQTWRYRNKLEYSFGTGPDGGARVWLSRTRGMEGDRHDLRLPARLRARQPGAGVVLGGVASRG